MKRIPLLFIALFLFNVFSLAQTYKGKSIISVDLNKEIGKMDSVWAWFGYDEPNYTYMKDGKNLLSELSAHYH